MHIKSDVAISDSGFVFVPATGESFTVNPIGAAIIHMLKENKSVEEVSKQIFENYKTDMATVEKDMNDFVAMLKQYSLIDTND